MNEQMPLIKLGDPMSEGDTRVTPVYVDGIIIGSIEGSGSHIVTWKPVSTKFGLQIATMTCFSRDNLFETVKRMIQKQFARLKMGEALRDEDITALHPDLQPWLIESDFLGKVLKHPLVFGVPYMEQMAPDYNARLLQKEKAIKQTVDERKWGTYIALHERPYRLRALLDIVDDLLDEEYWELVSGIWIDSENIFEHYEEWLELWQASNPGRETTMDEDERNALAALPDVLTIHRGYRHLDSKMGLSWTLDYGRAVWFANRFRTGDERAWVVSGKVRKDDILAYFLGRNEDEIVTLPDTIFEIRTKAIPRKTK